MKLLCTDRWENGYGETIVERSYRLTIAEGELEQGHLGFVLERACRLPDGWIKRIEFQVYKDGGLERQWKSYTPRPYVQGYGCDGQTGECIHLLAATLARRLGLDYESLYVRAYPDQEVVEGWCEFSEQVRDETVIPGEIDSLLALDDLMDINNYALADVLGDELIARGLVPENWGNIRSGEVFLARQEQALQRAADKQEG